jgi:hypothetical protein
MIRFRHWFVLSLVLVLLGSGVAWWKVENYGFPLRADKTDDSWTVQARIRLRPAEGPVKAELALPSQTPGLARLREDFISRGFGLDVQEARYSRTATWAIRRVSGIQTLYYRAQYYRDADQRDFAPRPAYPDIPLLDEPFATAMTAITDQARRQSADIASFTTGIISRINSESPSEEVRLFLNASRFEGDRIRIARTLLAGARIPTESINGLLLVDSERQARPVRWLAVHNEQRWLFFDPMTGREGIPDNLLVWWRGGQPAVVLEGAELVDVSWSVRRNPIGSLDLAQQRAEAHGFMLAGLSLQDLPVQTQSVYAALLLVPIGAFLLVLMRNVIGVRALGTFMPVLIALAFRETGLLGGLVLFVTVVAIGLIFRFYLERLRLLLVPRLSAVLTIVVLLMLGLSMFSQKLGWEVGLSVGLFPMVILAMVIERMSIIWEERGAQEALIEALGSTVIAVLAFLVMGLNTVQYLVFVFPELLLVVLGMTIALGRYSGYRFSELIRFRALVREPT